jgi:hypothetical protein
MMQPLFSKIVASGMMAIDLRYLRFSAALAAAAIGAFVVTLWATQPRSPPASAGDARSDGEKLASYRISSTTDLIEAVVAAGLATSPQMRANIDGITRVSESDVSIKGWLADVEGDATPLVVLVYVGGKLATRVQTHGERPDVTRALGLAFGTEKNVGFQASFGCRPGEQPIVIGLGADRRYIRIAAPRCP